MDILGLDEMESGIDGFRVKCDKCEYTFDALLGIGMLFPIVYRDNIKKMKSGEMGAEAKQFFEEHPNGVINSERVIARCEECGHYETVDDLTMYKPKNPKMKAPDYICEHELKDEYEKCMDYNHKCSKCGGKSKVLKNFVAQIRTGELKCEKCDGHIHMVPGIIINWD